MSDHKDPYDEAFEEGVGNWNLWILRSRMADDPFWMGATLLPDTKPAVTAYARAPYLGLLTTEELFERYRTLLVATMETTDDGFLSPAPWDEWHDKWIHVATELTLRKLSPSDKRAKIDSSFARSPRQLRALEARKRRRLDWGPDVLVKYGASMFLRQALEEGRFRLAPASYYDDPSLNAAQRDTELQRILTDTASDMTSTIGPLGDELTPDERAQFTRPVQAAVDYYIFCLAGGWHPRLFDDFDADACLVVTDPRRFARELGEAAAVVLPNWHYGCEYVRYIDPVQPLDRWTEERHQSFAPFFCKDFGYSYQQEVRAAWLPPRAEGPHLELEHTFVTMGSLTDYCELIEL